MKPALVERAIAFAVRAHEGQMRKEAPTPYIVHPVRVAILLARYGFSDEVVAAGLVHDVVEDTNISLEDIRRELGGAVAELVAPVTHDDTLSWIEKKKAYIESVREANDEVKAIATADKIANAESLLGAHKREGVAVWRYFNAEKEKKLWFEESMLAMLQESRSHPIVDEYAHMVSELKTLD
ncbi:MAG: HD domain-containing protein [Candidatus Paceibacterota bacterium]|jgi:(p)ppGpp synthase/HD superfamily hydrolase